ncbi:MAG: hypothetical protein LBJ67_08385 [Planctomycetaceae bacterium]|jgi:hypothetical protein|nr:hypothetical protein [Planctomycetaceae bacterium]
MPQVLRRNKFGMATYQVLPLMNPPVPVVMIRHHAASRQTENFFSNKSHTNLFLFVWLLSMMKD